MALRARARAPRRRRRRRVVGSRMGVGPERRSSGASTTRCAVRRAPPRGTSSWEAHPRATTAGASGPIPSRSSTARARSSRPSASRCPSTSRTSRSQRAPNESVVREVNGGRRRLPDAHAHDELRSGPGRAEPRRDRRRARRAPQRTGRDRRDRDRDRRARRVVAGRAVHATDPAAHGDDRAHRGRRPTSPSRSRSSAPTRSAGSRRASTRCSMPSRLRATSSTSS